MATKALPASLCYFQTAKPLKATTIQRCEVEKLRDLRNGVFRGCGNFVGRNQKNFPKGESPICRSPCSEYLRSESKDPCNPAKRLPRLPSFFFGEQGLAGYQHHFLFRLRPMRTGWVSLVQGQSRHTRELSNSFRDHSTTSIACTPGQHERHI